MLPAIEIWEFVLVILAAVLGLLTAFSVKPELRQFFVAGMSGRILGGLAFGSIYFFYYEGGDTIAYYNTSLPVCNLILENPSQGLAVWLQSFSRENYSLFTSSTGYPLIYIYKDSSTYAVSQILVPFMLLSFKSYLATTVLLSVTFFYGPWMFFKMICEIISGPRWLLAFACLLMPSALFWGSGISKDTLTYAASCYFVFGVYTVLIKRELTIWRVFLSITSGLLLLTVKPYIFMVLFPGVLCWTLYSQVQKIKNVWLRTSVLPLFLSVFVVFMSFVYSQLIESLGEYSFDNIVTKAIVTQEDLKRDYYGGNNFDIGTIDPSVAGLVSKFPIATFYGLFGPTLLEIRSAIMLFAAAENTLLLLLTLRILLIGAVGKIRLLMSSPFLIFCLVFTVLFAFSIGLTTPNYGALVRFKIPLVPFFALLLIILNYRDRYNIRKL